MLSILKTLSLFSGIDLRAKIPHFTSLHTLPDDGRSISRNVAEKHYDSRHDKLKNSMNTTESTNTNIFRIGWDTSPFFLSVLSCACDALLH